MSSTRRSLLTAFLTLPLIEAARTRAFAQAAPELPLTPACDDGDEPTLEREAGPFFRPNSPLNRDLYPDAPGGERITVAGFVFNNRCRPLAGSLVEIWQADEKGDYDSVGFCLRGHQFTDTQGGGGSTPSYPRFIPAERAISNSRSSARVGASSPPNSIFPGEPGNAGDWLFDEALLLDIRQP